MSDNKLTNDGDLTAAEAAALDADLALLMRDDPAPDLSAALSARILADAAEIAPRALPERSEVNQEKGRGFGAALLSFWQPMSAGLAAAALGVWLGWSDPVGVSLYAQSMITAELADPGGLDGEVMEPADLLDLEL